MSQTLIEKAKAAAAHWGVTALPTLLGHRENAVFAIELATGPAALRLHRQGYQTPAAIRSELWWCEALAARGTPVPMAIRDLSGALTVTLEDGQMASVMDWANGEMLGEGGRPLSGSSAEQSSLYRRLGVLAAVVHQRTDGIAFPGDFERPRWDETGLLGDEPLWGRFWEHPILNSAERAELEFVRAACKERLVSYSRGGAGFGLIHADMLRENVLVAGDAMTLIDFDDCGYGFRAYDLGIALSQNYQEPHRQALMESLIDGYNSIVPLRRVDMAMIPTFTLLRCLASFGWTVGRLPQDHPLNRRYLERAQLYIREQGLSRG